MTQSEILCPKCKIELKRGKSIQQTYYGSPAFSGCERVTMPRGRGEMGDCLKCEKCGYSISLSGDVT